MKKILVVLLILAVAGGVFAQEGSWTLGASAEIGTRINIDPNPGANDPVILNSTGYHVPYHHWGPTRGTLSIGYSRGALNIGNAIANRSDGSVWMTNITASGDNYRFTWEGNLLRFIGQSGAPVTGDPRIHRLWGEYKMLNEMLNLVIAYRGPDTQYWYSDDTGAILEDVVSAGAMFGNWSTRHHYLFGGGNGVTNYGRTFTRVDGNNFVAADFNFAGLNFGLLIPNIFPDAFTASAGDDGTTTDLAYIGAIHGSGSPLATAELVEHALKKSVFGVKLDMSPVEVAAQFRLYDYGIYFGGKFFAGPVTVGMSFMGILNDPSGSRTMKFGGAVDYNAGAFGAGIAGWYRNDRPTAIANVFNTSIGIEPSFFYNVIPTHLRFELNAGFYFHDVYDGGTVAFSKDIYWAVQPQLFWNFRGTGAGSFWGVSTGIIARYRIISEFVNAADIIFKFAL